MTWSHRFLTFAVLLWMSSLGLAQQILIPDNVAPYSPIVGRCDYVAPKNSTADFSWRIDSKATFIPVKDETTGLTDIYVWAPPGDHWVELTIVTQFYREITVWVPDEQNPEDFTKAKRQVIKITDKYDIQRITKDFKVLGDTPEPPGPNPPGPNPPGPVPPSPGEGLRVMIVEETEDRPKLPWSQQVALQSGNVIELLNSACAKDEKGKPDWRHYDDDYTAEQITKLPERWRKPYQDAVAFMRTQGSSPSVPVIIVSNTRKNPPGELTKLPANEQELMALISKYKDN